MFCPSSLCLVLFDFACSMADAASAASFDQSVGSLYDPDPSIDQELRTSGSRMAEQVQASIDGLRWCIVNFPAFSRPNTHLFVLTYVAIQFREPPEQLSPDLATTIHTLLFEHCVQRHDTFDRAVQLKLAECQSEFAIQAIPLSGADLLSSIFQWSAVPKFSFWASFCHQLILPGP
jgi:hypothetical protein